MLVGYTGFVGSNLCLSHNFNYLINSKNIETAFGVSPDTLIYSGVPAEMFIANKYPEKDKAIIDNAENNIQNINPKRTVLISTVAVYDCTDNVDEDYVPDLNCLTPYGKNRLALEKWVEENYKEHLIVRLPAIYGENLKKNFIYDYINYIPAMLTEKKYSGIWNDYQTPLVYMPTHPPLSTGVFEFSRSSSNATVGTPHKIAGCMILFLPIFIFFLIFHGRLMNNLSMGGIKE